MHLLREIVELALVATLTRRKMFEATDLNNRFPRTQENRAEIQYKEKYRMYLKQNIPNSCTIFPQDSLKKT